MNKTCTTMVAGPGASELWCVDTPLTRSFLLSDEALNLKSKPYNPDPDQWDHQLHILVDEENNDAGYLTFVEKAMNVSMKLGLHLYLEHELVKLEVNVDGATQLLFSNGKVASAGQLVLNIPQRPLLKILQTSNWLDQKINDALFVPTDYPLMKLYVHYDDAWW